MTDTVFEQIMKVRESGVVNMCDVRAVQRIAYYREMYDLVLYIEDSPFRYFHFILTAEETTQ
jgi:hypothetical protein